MFLWVVLFAAMYPDKQKKAQEEIDQRIGRDRSISLKDRSVLGYIEAFVLETIRFSNAVPFPLPRRALVDTPFFGYTVPRGTVLHHDKKY